MPSQQLNASRVVGLALAVGAFYTAQEVLMDLAQTRRAVSIRADVASSVEFWVVWALLTPIAMIVIRRWPPGGSRPATAVMAHLAAALTLAAVHNHVVIAVNALIVSLRPDSWLAEVFGSRTQYAFVWGMFTGLVYYAVLLMVSAAARFRGLYAAEQVSAAELQEQLTRSKLDALRSQLRPHFLFNTLNAISVFVKEDAAMAQQLILRLSALLRRSLDEEAHEVALDRELAFVEDYLDIQRARFGERLTVRTEIEPPAAGASVPVFLLQPLVENVIEHGTSDDRRTMVTLRARRDNGSLRITVEDDGPGFTDGSADRAGVGLGNTRERLRHLYGARGALTVGAAQPGSTRPGARIEIVIPYRAAHE